MNFLFLSQKMALIDISMRNQNLRDLGQTFNILEKFFLDDQILIVLFMHILNS